MYGDQNVKQDGDCKYPRIPIKLGRLNMFKNGLTQSRPRLLTNPHIGLGFWGSATIALITVHMSPTPADAVSHAHSMSKLSQDMQRISCLQVLAMREPTPRTVVLPPPALDASLGQSVGVPMCSCR